MNKQLLTEMQDAIKNTVTDKKIGVAFSGGVDSTLLAKLVKDMGYDIHLLTIGFQDSHDINFSQKINQTIKTDNLSWNENSIAFYYVAELAQKNDLKTVVTANGIDELFCGYNSYREAIETGEDEVTKMMIEKLKNEGEMMVAINQVTAEFGVRMIQPFLLPNFIEHAKKIPISETKDFYTVHDGQEGINCTVTEANSDETDPNFVNLIFEGSLELPPDRDAGQRIDITFSYDENQVIH